MSAFALHFHFHFDVNGACAVPCAVQSGGVDVFLDARGGQRSDEQWQQDERSAIDVVAHADVDVVYVSPHAYLHPLLSFHFVWFADSRGRAFYFAARLNCSHERSFWINQRRN